MPGIAARDSAASSASTRPLIASSMVSPNSMTRPQSPAGRKRGQAVIPGTLTGESQGETSRSMPPGPPDLLGSPQGWAGSRTMAPTIDLNCDMGEGFGVYKLGDDAAM